MWLPEQHANFGLCRTRMLQHFEFRLLRANDRIRRDPCMAIHLHRCGITAARGEDIASAALARDIAGRRLAGNQRARRNAFPLRRTTGMTEGIRLESDLHLDPRTPLRATFGIDDYTGQAQRCGRVEPVRLNLQPDIALEPRIACLGCIGTRAFAGFQLDVRRHAQATERRQGVDAPVGREAHRQRDPRLAVTIERDALVAGAFDRRTLAFHGIDEVVVRERGIRRGQRPGFESCRHFAHRLPCSRAAGVVACGDVDGEGIAIAQHAVFGAGPRPEILRPVRAYEEAQRMFAGIVLTLLLDAVVAIDQMPGQVRLAGDGAERVDARGPRGQRFVLLALHERERNLGILVRRTHAAFATIAQPQPIADGIAGPVQRTIRHAPEPGIDGPRSERHRSVAGVERQHGNALAIAGAQHPLRTLCAHTCRQTEIVRQDKTGHAAAVAASGDDATRRCIALQQQQFDLGTRDRTAAGPFGGPDDDRALRDLPCKFELRRSDIDEQIAAARPSRPPAFCKRLRRQRGVDVDTTAHAVRGGHDGICLALRQRSRGENHGRRVHAADRCMLRIAEQQSPCIGFEPRPLRKRLDPQAHRLQGSILLIAQGRAEREGFGRGRLAVAQARTRGMALHGCLVVVAMARPPDLVVPRLDRHRSRQACGQRSLSSVIHRRREQQPHGFAGHASGRDGAFAHETLHFVFRTVADDFAQPERFAIDELQQHAVLRAGQRPCGRTQSGNDVQHDLCTVRQVVGQCQVEDRCIRIAAGLHQPQRHRPFAPAAAQAQRACRSVGRHRQIAAHDDVRAIAHPLGHVRVQRRPVGFLLEALRRDGDTRRRGKAGPHVQGHRRGVRQRIAVDGAGERLVVFPCAAVAPGRYGGQ